MKVSLFDPEKSSRLIRYVYFKAVYVLHRKKNTHTYIRIQSIITGNSTSNNGKILPIIEIKLSENGIHATRQEMPTI